MGVLSGKMFLRVGKCVSLPHLMIVDCVMNLFEKDYFVNVLKAYKEQAVPILWPIFEQ